MAQLDYVLQAFSAYVDGFPKLGSGERIQTPMFKKAMEKFRGGGMLAEREISMGYQAYTLEVNLSEYDPQVLSQCGLFSRKDLPLSVRGHFDGDSNTSHTGVLTCRGEFKEINPDAWEPSKKAGIKTVATLQALKLKIDDKLIYEIDIPNGVYVFGDEDAGARVRASIGF
jgi:P2 family phage contractile tail tube protein